MAATMTAAATILPGVCDEAEGFWEQPTKLFVGGLSTQTTTEGLQEHFSRYGHVVDAVVMQKNGHPRGFGFVTFDSGPAPGPAALVLAEPQWLDGRRVDVKYAVPGEKGASTPLSQQLGKEARKSNKLFIGGLPQDITTEDLKGYFSSYGKVADVVVMVDRQTSRSRGFGFVRFGGGAEGAAAADAALADFSAHRIGGKWVEVKRATPGAQMAQEAMAAEGILGGADGTFLLPTDFSPFGSWPASADPSPASAAGNADSPASNSSDRNQLTANRAKAGRKREKYSGANHRSPLGEVSSPGLWNAAASPMNSNNVMLPPFFFPHPFDGDWTQNFSSPDSIGSKLMPQKDKEIEMEDSENKPPSRGSNKIKNNYSTATTPAAPPGLFGAKNSSSTTTPIKMSAAPMKILASDGRSPQEDYFTREDFLSLEVRPVLSV